jgi:hypothetical protein
MPECRQVKNIIPSIAYQLARFSLPFRHALARALELDADVHARAVRVQYEKLVVEPLMEVQSCLPVDFIVVIDALDECENEDSVGRILNLLMSTSSIVPIRFLISSRPEKEIVERMTGRVEYQDEVRLILHDLESEIVRTDIEAYMRYELKNIPLTEAQWLHIIDRCGALFIYASTTCRYLEQAYSMRTLDEALDVILNSASISKDHGEDTIDELYSTILTTAFSKSTISQANKARMRTLLETVVCAVEPMTLGQLAEIANIANMEQANALIQPLRSLLNLTKATGLVTALHASFPDYMLSSDRSLAFYCDQSVRHATMAAACLRIINTCEPKFNVCRLPSSYLLDKEVKGLSGRVHNTISPGLTYASRHWSTHLHQGEYRIELMDYVRNFFMERLLLWMEIINLKGLMRCGTAIIHDAEKWCSVSRKSCIDLS